MKGRKSGQGEKIDLERKGGTERGPGEKREEEEMERAKERRGGKKKLKREIERGRLSE